MQVVWIETCFMRAYRPRYRSPSVRSPSDLHGLIRRLYPIPAIAFFLEISLSSLRNSLRKRKKWREYQVLFFDITVLKCFLKCFLKRRSTFPSNLLVHLSSCTQGSQIWPPSFISSYLPGNQNVGVIIRASILVWNPHQFRRKFWHQSLCQFQHQFVRQFDQFPCQFGHQFDLHFECQFKCNSSINLGINSSFVDIIILKCFLKQCSTYIASKSIHPTVIFICSLF